MSGCCGQGPVIIGGTGGPPPPGMDGEPLLLCDTAPDGTVTAFLRTYVYDEATGDVLATRDTALDGTTGYTPTGAVTACGGQECRESTTVLLCDTAPDGTSTPFLRHLTVDCATGAVTATADTALDGAPYTPTGTVAVCQPAEGCAQPTTPTTAVGLCLADGTPIAVTVVRDCDGIVTQEGWVNLATGAYSAGAPPAGAGACGDSQSVELSGTFCDLDPATGNVLGLVLIEYSYAPDGTIDSVRLVDAVTGATYTPQGDISVCPAGVEQPEQDIVQLCDTAADGTVTEFIRDYRRDETGAIVGHSDYALDGAPYAPSGTVGLCTPCRSSHSEVLCDSASQDLGPLLTFTDTDPTPYFQPNPPDANNKLPALVSGQPFWDGGTVTIAPDPAGDQEPMHRYIAALITAEGLECPPCGPAGEVTLTLTATVANNGPVLGYQTAGRWHLHNGTTQLANQTITNVGASGNFPSARALSITAPVSFADLAAGKLAIVLDLETSHGGEKTWDAYSFAVTATLAETPGCGMQFLRTYRTDCATGDLVDVIDTDLTGAPYTPVGEAIPCQPPMPCGASEACSRQVIERCACDDADGDGVPEVPFTELWAVDPCNGEAPALLGTCRDGDFTQPYTPVAPGDCPASDDQPQPVLTGAQRLTDTATTDLVAAHPGLQSVTMTVLAGEGTVSTDDGTVTVPAGAALTWSITNEGDEALSTWSGGGAAAGADVLLNYTYRS